MNKLLSLGMVLLRVSSTGNRAELLFSSLLLAKTFAALEEQRTQSRRCVPIQNAQLGLLYISAEHRP